VLAWTTRRPIAAPAGRCYDGLPDSACISTSRAPRVPCGSREIGSSTPLNSTGEASADSLDRPPPSSPAVCRPRDDKEPTRRLGFLFWRPPRPRPRRHRPVPNGLFSSPCLSACGCCTSYAAAKCPAGFPSASNAGRSSMAAMIRVITSACACSERSNRASTLLQDALTSATSSSRSSTRA
jgi:hypothetical protein